ncbi:MAG TPA: squalene/phytoene synthase family protein [Acidimicrobiia bacterium]|nr:squalene/phytoene synthase family protein [Acidimicrobiia bacterium]
MSVPFALRRPWLLVRGARAGRDRPDLDRLAAIDDPIGFVWAILPHAARTFATSILMLPAAQARTAAVAYLYCRMLDTYEDLGDHADREAALEMFAARMKTLEPPPPVPAATARGDRDRVHLLLIERCRLVDRVYAALPGADRQGVAELVQAMADGMAWSSRRFAEQGGVLIDAGQLSRYCHHVMGQPVLFTLQLVGKADLTAEQRRDALAAGELIQLANITRDVERDLARGIGYHPSLLPHLGSTNAAGPVREARRHLMAQALPHAPAYTRLAKQLAPGRFSLARASAVLMLLYTDRHYRWCARRIGHPDWRGPNQTGTIILASLLAAFSPRWSHRVMRRVEQNFLSAAEAI